MFKCITPPVYSSGFNVDVDEVSRLTGLAFDPEVEPSLTQQSFKEEVDINTIVKRFGITGEIPGDFRPPISGDFVDVVDFQTAMQAVRQAEENFAKLPAEVRARFANDPQNLISFLDDSQNRDEAIKLGLVSAPPERTRDAVQAIDELAAVLKPKT